ncbi:unnamed protein product [Didymodactylos carnosus]|uniref:Uncharacterized protein n=1 Tax=Didymodactylos carnosus TaxID=1234261 RepID=A0A813T9U0_9BILA|nr:unnamed protein product [Didymodactylos carnosus]CAF0813914.1 unnamed protein product [Didymodactylos carnosus]CAF3593994.1 unnamed protein product [Didymodactylos carnosus]CAF3597827.1 unnamed protein product [Didymodactylos carnosus]
MRLLLLIFVLQVLFVSLTSSLFSDKKVKNARKYELQQKIFSFGNSYTIKDDKAQPVYKVSFKKLGLGKHLKLTDVSSNRELYGIKHILNPLGLATYEITQNNKTIASVKRKFALTKKFSVKSPTGAYKIDGNFRSREFNIKKGKQLVARISKKFFTLSDKYGVEIQAGEDPAFICALTIVIDEVAHG